MKFPECSEQFHGQQRPSLLSARIICPIQLATATRTRHFVVVPENHGSTAARPQGPGITRRCRFRTTISLIVLLIERNNISLFGIIANLQPSVGDVQGTIERKEVEDYQNFKWSQTFACDCQANGERYEKSDNPKALYVFDMFDSAMDPFARILQGVSKALYSIFPLECPPILSLVWIHPYKLPVSNMTMSRAKPCWTLLLT